MNKISTLLQPSTRVIWQMVVVLLISVAVSVLVFVGYSQWSVKNETAYSSSITKQLVAEIDTRYTFLLDFLHTIEFNESLRRDIAEQDLLSITTTVNSLKDSSGIKLMVVTDSEGIALSRARFQGKRGDYFFDTSPMGRELAAGNDVKMIVDRGIQLPLIVAAGIPLFDEAGSIIGSLTASEDMGSLQAQNFKQTFLREHDQIAFYESNHGLVGSSFAEENASVVAVALEGTVRAIDPTVATLDPIEVAGRTYLIQHVSFSNLDTFQQSTGGALLFIEVADAPVWLLWGISVGIVVLLLAALGLSFMVARPKKIIDVGILLVAVLIVCSVVIGGLQLQTIEAPRAENQTYSIYNSTMELSPANGIFDTNFEQRTSVLIESGGEPINATLVEIVFDPSQILVEDIVDTGTFCTPGFIVERSIDNEAGVVRFGCGSITPSIDTVVKVVDIVFRPLTSGNTELLLTDNSSVLAHDGLGTDVLRKRTSASYQVREESDTEDVILFSQSHPNASKWESAAIAEFTWRGGEYDTFAYQLARDNTASITPTTTTIQGRKVSVPVPDNGDWYFQLQPVVAGELVGSMQQYKIKVDQTPPEEVRVRLSQTEIVSGELLRMEFEAVDTDSGIESPYYYISYNGETFFPVQSPFYTALTQLGDTDIVIRAYDNAGNYTETKSTVTVSKAPSRILQQSASVLQSFAGKLTQ